MSNSHCSPVPPRPRQTRLLRSLTKIWSTLPVPRRQEALLVLSQIIAKKLPAAVRKEAGHDRL